MSGWTVGRRSGQLLEIANDTGEPVTDVHFRLAGVAVGGRSGRRDWSARVDEMGDGDYIEEPFRRGWGADQDPPRIEVSWTSQDGRRLSTVLTDLPI